MGIKWRMSWLVLIDHPFLMDFHYRAGRQQLRLLPRLAINQGCTDFLPPLPPLLPSTAALCPPFAKPPPIPLLPAGIPPPQSQTSTQGSPHQPWLQKGGNFPSGPDSLGGGCKTRNRYNTACFIIIFSRALPHNQQLKLIDSPSPPPKKWNASLRGSFGMSPSFYVIF